MKPEIRKNARQKWIQEREDSIFLPSPQPIDENKILELMEVPSFPNVFFVGKNSRRVSFSAQQVRALNLVWALSESGKFIHGNNVLVVGAGLAGLTASVAAAAVGFKARVIERRSELLHLQVGNAQRFIHPRIAEWPQHGSTERDAKLPCLNWSADIAGKVAELIEQNWRRAESHFRRPEGVFFEDGSEMVLSTEEESDALDFNTKTRLQLFTLCEVKDISYRTGKKLSPIVTVAQRSGASQIIHRIECDAVLICCGFGLEQQWKKVGFLSYWDNDNLVRAILTEPIPRKVLVTGIGDGGLTDAMRACLQSVSHQNIVQHLTGIKLRIKLDRQRQDFAKELDGEEVTPINFSLQKKKKEEKHRDTLEMMRMQLLLERNLVRIEKEAETLFQKKALPELDRRLELWLLETKANRKNWKKQEIEVEVKMVSLLIRESIVSQFLFDQYLELKRNPKLSLLFDAMEELVVNHSRSDVSIILNGEAPTPMTLKSMPVNRFGVFLLMQKGILQYQQGKAELIEDLPQGEFLVRFHAPKLTPYVESKTMIFQQIIVRHGVESPLKGLFGESLTQQLISYTGKSEFDHLATPLYSETFAENIEKNIADTEEVDETEWILLKDKCRGLLQSFLKEITSSANAKNIRATIWRPYPTLRDRRLRMVCPYQPGDIRSKLAESEETISSSKGLIGLAVSKRKPFLFKAPEDEIEYKLVLLRDFRQSCSDIELINHERKVCFSYPIVGKNSMGTEFLLGVLWCDFATVDSFEKCKHKLMSSAKVLSKTLCDSDPKTSEPLELAAPIGDWLAFPHIEGVEIFSETSDKIEDPVEMWELLPEHEYCLESHWRQISADTQEEQLICLLKTKQKERTLQRMQGNSEFSKIESEDRHFVLLSSKPHHSVGDILKIRGLGPIGRVVKVNQPVESLPQASLRDKTAYPNHALVTFIEIFPKVKIPPRKSTAPLSPRVKSRVTVEQGTEKFVGTVRALDCSIEASYARDTYWFDDVFEIQLTDDSGKKESMESGIVFVHGRVLGTVVWSSADVVYAFPLSAIVRRLNMELLHEFSEKE